MIEVIQNLKKAYISALTIKITIVSRCEIFPSAFEFLNKAMDENENNKVLIHCKSGVNRSNTLTIGFLMEFQNITLKEA